MTPNEKAAFERGQAARIIEEPRTSGHEQYHTLSERAQFVRGWDLIDKHLMSKYNSPVQREA